MGLPAILLLVSGLLILVSFVQRLAARLSLPASILFAVMGIAIGALASLAASEHTNGPLGDLARSIVDVPITSETFLYVLLPALLFQSALTVDVRRILDDLAPILLLAIVAVLIATGVIGLALAPIAPVSIIACLLVASLVSTTDTVAVISIFRDVGAPARLCRLVEGESLLNDAAAIVTFTVLLGILTGGQATGVGGAAFAFARTFLGGILAGYVGARLVVAVLPSLQDLRLAQATLTLALPYVVFIAGERGLGVSGVIAAVTSGLVLTVIGQPRVAPSDWKFLIDLWEQLAYWASSLIFVLAALRVPFLLGDVGWHDVLVLAVMIVAALGARALVLFGLLPMLSVVGLSQRVEHRYNLVILWGGLRGAVTLALALAVTENPGLSADVHRFVAVLATGFVLFTLLVQGLTLRGLIRWLGLDRLSPFDQAIRAEVLALSRRRVAATVQQTGAEYRLNADLVGRVVGTYTGPAAALGPRLGALTAPTTTAQHPVTRATTDDERLRLGLVALTQRERELILAHFDARAISGRTVEELLSDVAQMLDRARTGDHVEYVRMAHQLTGFSRAFKVAHWLHRRFRVDGPLVDRLADRFERLLVGRIVLEELTPYVDATLADLVGGAVVPRLKSVLAARQQMLSAALEAMAAEYPEYASLLEERFLRRLALRREDVEYRALYDEHVIGPELFNVLQRELTSARAAMLGRPALDLGLETRALIARVPMFAELGHKQLDALGHLLKPRLAVPDERLISVGDDGDSMSFISSGVVEVMAAGKRILLTRGDFFGEMALVRNQKRQADVTALSYCHLLILERHDFQTVLRSSPAIRERIDKAADERFRMNEQAAARTQGSPSAEVPDDVAPGR